MKHCHRCNRDFPDNRKFCEYCGSKLVDIQPATSESIACPNCNAAVERQWKFCKSCSARLAPAIHNPDPITSAQPTSPALSTAAITPQTIRTGATSSATQTTTAPPRVLIRCPSCRHLMEEDVAFCESCGTNMIEGASRAGLPVSAAWPTQTPPDSAAESDRRRLDQEAAKEEAQRRAAREREEAERQRLDKDRAEAERLRIDQERAAAAERVRIEAERAAEAERLAEAERVRLAQAQAAEVERLRLEQETHAQAARLRLEQERVAKAERLRLEQESAAQAERLRLEQKAEAERLRLEQAQARTAAERLRLEQEKAAEAERVRLARIEHERSIKAAQPRTDRAPTAENERRIEETWPQADLTKGLHPASLDLFQTQAVPPQPKEAKVAQKAPWESPHAPVALNPVSATPAGDSDQSSHLPSWAVTPEAPKHRGRWIVAALALIMTVAVVIVFALRSWQPKTATTETKPAPAMATPPNMVYVPGGEFLMGVNSGDEYERPAHKVLVKPFFIDTFEVTCDDYDKFLKATGRNAPPSWVNGTYASSAAHTPVTGVNWDDANAYAHWAKKRLPTEEEWELAARGSDGRKYPWGNEWKQGQANANSASHGLAEVGKFEGRSPVGLADMIGNAWEWTSSSIHSYEGGKIAEDELSEADRNKMKVIRGGCYLSNSAQATATYRRGWPPLRGPADFNQTGFRCALDAPGKN